MAGAECAPLALAQLTVHFGTVSVTDATKRGLDQIREGFARARDVLSRSGQDNLAGEVDWFETRYTQAYLEREALPHVLTITKRALDAGYQVIIAVDHRGELRHRIRPLEYVTLGDIDAASNCQLTRILPELRDGFAALQAQFGRVADYCGDSVDYEQRRELRREFLAGRFRVLYTTYGPGTGPLPLCDADYPELGITGGTRPRVSIFLSPPPSAHLLVDAALLTWRAQAKSDVHAVFLSTDSSCDAELLQQKVGPFLRAMGGNILGERISVREQISAITEGAREAALEAALAFAEGKVENVNAAKYYVRSKNQKEKVSINDWSQIDFPPADSAKRKQCSTAKELRESEVRDQYLAAFCIDPRLDRTSNTGSVLQELSGADFEKLIATLLTRMGFQTEMTKTSGDGGIDIVAVLDKPVIGGRFLVQCKRYAPDNLVGASIVRDFYGAVTADRGTKGIIITTSDFTAQARGFAQRVGVELIPLEQLKRLLLENGLHDSCSGIPITMS